MPEPERAQRLALLLAALLLAQAAAGYATRFRQEPGLDFYHFWGIAAARKLADGPLGTPYEDAAGYTEVLNRAADASRDRHFQRANRARRDPQPGAEQLFDPTSTPLAYASFAWLPRDYSRAHVVFRSAQFLAFTTGVALWLGLLGFRSGSAWLAAGALSLAFRPFAIDVNVGNLASFQLLLLAGLARLLQGVGPAPGASFGLRHACVGAGLAAFVLFKPNLAHVALFLAVAYALRVPPAVGLRAASSGLVAAILLLAATSLWLGDAGAWSAWWRYLYGDHPERLVSYPVAAGNQSTPLLVALLSGVGAPLGWAALIGLALLGSLALTLARRGGALTQVVAPLRDPPLAAALGVVFGLGCAPLTWNHYLVVAVIPAGVLLLRGPRPGARGLAALGAAGAASLLAFAFYAGGLDALLGLLTRAAGSRRYGAWQPVLAAFAWLPLWLHLLLVVARDGDRPQRRPAKST